MENMKRYKSIICYMKVERFKNKYWYWLILCNLYIYIYIYIYIYVNTTGLLTLKKIINFTSLVVLSPLDIRFTGKCATAICMYITPTGPSVPSHS